MKNNSTIIILKSRYKPHHLVQYKDDTPKQYIFKASSNFIRVGYMSDGSLFIDPDGGPLLTKNVKIWELGMIIRDVRFIKDVGYLITFK